MSKADQTAVIVGKKRLTFPELEERAGRFINALKIAGLREGDAVCMMLANSCEFAEIAYACEKGGFWIAPINRSLTAEEVRYIVNDSGAKAFIASEATFAAAKTAMAEPQLLFKAIVGESYEDLLNRTPPVDLVPSRCGGRMYYTSGTTGRPKGVRKHPGNPEDEKIRQARWPAPLVPGTSVNLCPGPLYHAAPLKFDLILPLFKGVTAVLMERFDAKTFLALIEEHRVTHCHMVATMFHRLLDLPESVRKSYDTSSLKQILHGAAPTPVAVKSAMIDWFGPIIHEYYGGSEGGGTDITSAEWLEKPGSVGRAWHGRRVVILGADDKPAQAGQVGRVFFDHLGEPTFSYYNDPEKTKSAYVGSLYTIGDHGYLDADGFLFLTGRSAEVIIAGGVNIYPAEVDEALLAHPSILDAATIGIPHSIYGEEVRAVVTLKPGLVASDSLKDELLLFCQGRLAKFKCPRSVDFVAALPRSEAGKIQRHKVRQTYWSNEAKQI